MTTVVALLLARDASALHDVLKRYGVLANFQWAVPSAFIFFPI